MSKDQAPWPAPRYLLRFGIAPRVASEVESTGYTELAARAGDELEPLDAQQWADHVDERSKRDEEQRRKFEAASREQARRLMNFEDRLVSAHEEARRRCIDVASEVRLVRHMRDKGKSVRHLETRLFTIERKVWKDGASLEDAA